MLCMLYIRDRSANWYICWEEGKDQESTLSRIIPDPEHHIGKWRKHKKHNTQESQEVSPFPAGDHKATRNRQYSITKIIKNHKYIKTIHNFKEAPPWNGQ